jgi:hypothetical protein
MKYVIFFSFLVIISCSLVPIKSSCEFDIPDTREKIAWSRAHGYVARNEIYYFDKVNDYVIDFSGVYESTEFGKVPYSGMIIREWAEKGYRYQIIITHLHESHCGWSAADSYRLELDLIVECKKIENYIQTGEMKK